MRIAVFSDSHGNVEDMCSAVEQLSPDMIFHLGDYCDDAKELHRRYPSLPLHMVRGNCDMLSTAPVLKTVPVGKYSFMLCHGHKYGVKSGLGALIPAAVEKRVDAVLFGHTHKAWEQRQGKMLVLNPGSMSGRGTESFAMLQVKEEGIEHWFVEKDGSCWTELK